MTTSCCRGLVAAFFVVTLMSVACAPSVGETPATGTSMPASIVEPYLEIQTALAEDSTDNVKANAGKVATAATALGAPAMKIQTAALQLSATAEAAEPDINRVREKFAPLSEAIDAYVTGQKLTLPDGVRVATCPMVHKPWLQKGDAIANPYYGKEMPTCGSFR